MTFVIHLYSKVCTARLSERAPSLTRHHAQLLTEENILIPGTCWCWTRDAAPPNSQTLTSHLKLRSALSVPSGSAFRPVSCPRDDRLRLEVCRFGCGSRKGVRGDRRIHSLMMSGLHGVEIQFRKSLDFNIDPRRPTCRQVRVLDFHTGIHRLLRRLFFLTTTTPSTCHSTCCCSTTPTTQPHQPHTCPTCTLSTSSTTSRRDEEPVYFTKPLFAKTSPFITTSPRRTSDSTPRSGIQTHHTSRSQP